MSSANLPRGGALQIFTLQQGTNFKTAAVGDYVPTLVYSYGVGKQKPLQDDPILGLANVNNNAFDEISPAPGLTQVGGQIVAPLDFAHAGLWLESAFGAATVTGADPNFVHTFTSGKAVLPERTIERQMPKASGTIMLQTVGLMVDKVTLQASRTAGYARLAMDCVGYDEKDLNGVTATGTPPAMWDRDPIAAALGVYKIDGAAAALLECNVSYMNNLQPREELGDDRVAGYDPQTKKVSGTIRMRLRDLTLVNAAENGTSHQGELLFQKSTNRLLSWLMPVVRLERPVVNNEGPEGIDVTFNLRAEQTTAAPMLTVTLKSSVDDFTGL